ncbi:hypothetical protein EX895_001363 [Sporisorium graminicola]|uniref:U6 small nuclear RNA (adenine-(43)-N(6))-methyltransferase n=1 Tax=Sporisorium graminicola TaxID=280036 RepID=A0A4U7L1D9_9BASI|nr:hypothetical protein EX895_001363 [Sporisorium graminicola]TKY89578.1 hypothetical protein EX895_001363 [Sporisorium graminicola]
MLRPRIDPRIYRSKTPNFRQLAIKYSSTFGVFVKDEGGYEAKIDFHDADAVRCLAQTLLLDDFGIRATLSPSNLCPMIPNRLAYISLIHELLSWTLPTWHLLHHFQRCPLDATVRGLDIGTGASAIYPVLGAACFAAWRFVGTDIDEGSLEYARQHVVDCAADEVKGRIALLRVGEDEAFVSGQETGGLDFTMCNPPFYSSRQEMDELARFKKQPANAVCHGTPSEMIVSGGEVCFVQRMIQESLAARKKVLWWTCMLGKLSSVVTLSGELKQLGKEGKVAGWVVHELSTGGGRTKRWVIMWTAAAATALRIPDTLSRDGLPGTLEKTKPVSAERCGNVLKLGSDWTRKELLAVTTRILNELEGCSIYPSAYQQLQGGHARSTHTALTADTGTIDVIVTRESWTRKARRAKLQTTDTTPASNPRASIAGPLLMARISFRESQTNRSEESGETGGLVVKVSWTYGMDAVKFESFAMFLLAAVERRVVEDSPTPSQ